MADKQIPDKELVEDIAQELEFLDKLKEKEIVDQLEILKEVYQAQMAKLVTSRIDEEAFQYWVIAEPNVAANQEELTNTRTSLRRIRKVIAIIRRHMMILKEAEKKHGKKD